MKAKNLIEEYDAWTQCANGRNSAGTCLGVHEPDTTSWCAVGAIYKTYEKDQRLREETFEKLADYLVENHREELDYIGGVVERYLEHGEKGERRVTDAQWIIQTLNDWGWEPVRTVAKTTESKASHGTILFAMQSLDI